MGGGGGGAGGCLIYPGGLALNFVFSNPKI
jgi:hypothetical protein